MPAAMRPCMLQRGFLNSALTSSTGAPTRLPFRRAAICALVSYNRAALARLPPTDATLTPTHRRTEGDIDHRKPERPVRDGQPAP